jgi:hypothetical protein
MARPDRAPVQSRQKVKEVVDVIRAIGGYRGATKEAFKQLNAKTSTNTSSKYKQCYQAS